MLSFRALLMVATPLIVLSAETAMAQSGGTRLVNKDPRALTADDVAALVDKPIDWNVARGTPSPTRPNLPRAIGKPGQSSSGRPHANADREARRLFPEAWQNVDSNASALDQAESIDTPAGTDGVFTQYSENAGGNNLNFPQRAIGKLFSSGGSCSASVISPNNIVATAGHCCYNRTTGAFLTNWRFSPAHRRDSTPPHPFGLFNWNEIWVLNAWINGGWRDADLCLIRFANNAAGRSLTFYTGWLGRSWNFGAVQHHHSVGYPTNVGNGRTMELCASESYAGGGTGCGDALNTGCNMTFGSSGGPWIRDYRIHNRVNSVVSGPACTGGTFGATYTGPRFTDNNIVVLCNLMGGC